eukprot:scaffold8624_cov110-Isochrysis_galbana.AAC.3
MVHGSPTTAAAICERRLRAVMGVAGARRLGGVRRARAARARSAVRSDCVTELRRRYGPEAPAGARRRDRWSAVQLTPGIHLAARARVGRSTPAAAAQRRRYSARRPPCAARPLDASQTGRRPRSARAAALPPGRARRSAPPRPPTRPTVPWTRPTPRDPARWTAASQSEDRDQSARSSAFLHQAWLRGRSPPPRTPTAAPPPMQPGRTGSSRARTGHPRTRPQRKPHAPRPHHRAPARSGRRERSHGARARPAAAPDASQPHASLPTGAATRSCLIRPMRVERRRGSSRCSSKWRCGETGRGVQGWYSRRACHGQAGQPCARSASASRRASGRAPHTPERHRPGWPCSEGRRRRSRRRTRPATATAALRQTRRTRRATAAAVAKR